MTITIEKRTRAVNTDPWGAWASTTDIPPYNNTDLLEYRSVDGATTINIADITDNLTIQTDTEGNQYATGDGYFDDLMESVNTQLKAQYDNGRITGTLYAQVYASVFQVAMSQSIQFALNKRSAEARADKAEADATISEINADVADSTKQDKINISGYKADVEETNRDIAVGTEANKIALVAQQLAKLTADTDYVGAQQTALEEQVIDNRLIKGIDALGDTYGTFGAGGLTVSSDMWANYYGMIFTLTGQAAPASTTVTKVT